LKINLFEWILSLPAPLFSSENSTESADQE